MKKIDGISEGNDLYKQQNDPNETKTTRKTETNQCTKNYIVIKGMRMTWKSNRYTKGNKNLHNKPQIWVRWQRSPWGQSQPIIIWVLHGKNQ